MSRPARDLSDAGHLMHAIVQLDEVMDSDGGDVHRTSLWCSLIDAAAHRAYFLIHGERLDEIIGLFGEES